MRSIKIFIVIACFAVVGVLTTAFVNIRNLKTAKADNAGKGFAVIELFTSEGCSSCPPADALVARVQKESNDKPVYILAFHVDYWNRLGWKDVFSSAEYSERQEHYARLLNLSSVYTPQIVVNGRTEFVGSEEGNLRNAIRTSLQKPAKAEITLSDVKINGDKASLQYHTEGATNNTSLLIALIEKTATSNVKKGENSGRTLSHVQIVRKLQTISLNGKSSGTSTIEVPPDLSNQGLEIVVFLQDQLNGEIIAATKS